MSSTYLLVVYKWQGDTSDESPFVMSVPNIPDMGKMFEIGNAIVADLHSRSTNQTFDFSYYEVPATDDG